MTKLKSALCKLDEAHRARFNELRFQLRGIAAAQATLRNG